MSRTNSIALPFAPHDQQWKARPSSFTLMGRFFLSPACDGSEHCARRFTSSTPYREDVGNGDLRVDPLEAVRGGVFVVAAE
jgi:hypothetical protein